MKIIIAILSFSFALQCFSQEACLGLFAEKLSTSEENIHSELFGIKTGEISEVYQQLKAAAYTSKHIGQNRLANRNLEHIYRTLNSSKYADSNRERNRTALIDRLIFLMRTNQMTLENYIEFSKDFLILVGSLRPNEVTELRASFDIQLVRKALESSGLLILPLHLADGVFSPFELNFLWTHAILPVGIPSRGYLVDLRYKNPFEFFMHDLAHARNRISKVILDGGRLSGTLSLVERTRILYLEILKIATQIPELDKYMQELVLYHLHEGGSWELTSTHDFLSHYFLKSYGDLDINESFLRALRSGDKSAQKQVHLAAKNLVKELFKKYDTYKNQEIRKITIDELAHLISTVLIFQTHLNEPN
jgi:hypothetical protein